MKMQTKRLWLLRVLTAGLAASFVTSNASAEEKAKTTEVKIEALKLAVPSNWKNVKPSSSMRKGQFNIPAVKGEKNGAEITIFQFPGGGGALGANIRRWIGQFQPKGRKVKVTKGTSKQGDYHLVDIQGTYNMPIGRPFERKTKAVPNGRMIGIILDVKAASKTYYIKAAGNGKTIAANADALRTAIGADKSKETELKPSSN